jgi:type II secretory pathway pseudopilin PulG
MINFIKVLLKHPIRSSPAKFDQNYQVKGMTMIELLVGTIIAFIVITPLMGMVLGLLNDDQRESAKANTEEEIQSALDYIGEDVSQALYIYVPKKQEKTSSGTTITTDEIQSLIASSFLPKTGTPDNEKPVLVFWKRKLVEDAVPVDSTKLPKDCTPTTCDDTYVLSLVSYHLLPPETDKTSIWCQPSASDKPCPSRIVRYEISDGLKKSDGTYYTEAELGTELKSYAGDPTDNKKPNSAYDPAFTLSDPLKNVTDKTKIGAATKTVLVNYIPDFKLDDSSTNNLAKLTIQANAMRRNDATACCPTGPNVCDPNDKPNSPPYCPKSSVQLRGLSGLRN